MGMLTKMEILLVMKRIGMKNFQSKFEGFWFFSESQHKTLIISGKFCKQTHFSLILDRQPQSNTKKSIIWKDWESLKRTVTNEYYSKLCKRIQSKDKAKITVKLEGPTFRKYRRSMRVSFTDKLGSIGGTLGLFSGFSLMAIVE